MELWLALNSQRSSCLCFPSVGIKGMHHHAVLWHLTFKCNICIYSLRLLYNYTRNFNDPPFLPPPTPTKPYQHILSQIHMILCLAFYVPFFVSFFLPFFFFSFLILHWVKLVLSICLWVWGDGQSISSHTPKEKWFSLLWWSLTASRALAKDDAFWATPTSEPRPYLSPAHF